MDDQTSKWLWKGIESLKKMKILAIDTSGLCLNIAIFNSDTNFFLQHTDSKIEKRAHSRNILLEIIKLFKKAKWNFFELNKVILTSGPGSFTGLRIGATVAKIISDQCSCQLCPVSTLKTIAFSHHTKKNLDKIPFINARNNNAFCMSLKSNGKIIMPEAHRPFNLFISKIFRPSCFICEKGTDNDFKDKIKAKGFALLEVSAPNLINAQALIDLGRKVSSVNPTNFKPNYLRKTAAEMRWIKKHPKDAEKASKKYVSEI